MGCVVSPIVIGLGYKNQGGYMEIEIFKKHSSKWYNISVQCWWHCHDHYFCVDLHYHDPNISNISTPIENVDQNPIGVKVKNTPDMTVGWRIGQLVSLLSITATVPLSYTMLENLI